jgi:hypothetical protein
VVQRLFFEHRLLQPRPLSHLIQIHVLLGLGHSKYRWLYHTKRNVWAHWRPRYERVHNSPLKSTNSRLHHGCNRTWLFNRSWCIMRRQTSRGTLHMSLARRMEEESCCLKEGEGRRLGGWSENDELH